MVRQYKKKMKEATEEKNTFHAEKNAKQKTRNGATYNAGARTNGELGKRISAAAAVAAAAR